MIISMIYKVVYKPNRRKIVQFWIKNTFLKCYLSKCKKRPPPPSADSKLWNVVNKINTLTTKSNKSIKTNNRTKHWNRHLVAWCYKKYRSRCREVPECSSVTTIQGCWWILNDKFRSLTLDLLRIRPSITQIAICIICDLHYLNDFR